MAEQNGKGPVAALFDVDGTLVDTNYLHAVTWWEAFTQAGYQVPMARIHRAIGMGSGQMLDRLLPADRDKDADVRAAHSALDKIGVPAGEAVFTGDTVWDVQACQKAGVPCIGVLSGGRQPRRAHLSRRGRGLPRPGRPAGRSGRKPAGERRRDGVIRPW